MIYHPKWNWTRHNDVIFETSTLHQPWLVCHCPGIQSLPEMRDDGLVNVPPMWVDLHIESVSTQDKDKKPHFELRHIPVLDLRIRGIIRPCNVNAFH